MPIRSVYDFYINARTLLIGQEVSMLLIRGGHKLNIKFELKGTPKIIGRSETFGLPSLNLNLKPIPPSYRILWGLSHGVIADDSYKPWGISKGDAILEVNGKPVNNQYDLIRLASSLRKAVFRVFSPKTKKYKFVKVFISP